MDGRIAHWMTAGAAVGALAGGCGADRPAPARACTESPRAVAAALQAAPGPVHLDGGTTISTCVVRSRSDGDVQALGAVYTRVADDLAARAPRSDRASLELGFLVGATRRGAARTNGMHAELQRRLENVLGVDGAPPERRAAYRRGLAAGARRG